VNSRYSTGIGSTAAPPTPGWLSAFRAVRGAVFLLVFFLYLLVGLGLSQRVIVFPFLWLFPKRRDRVLGPWIRAHARITRALARFPGGVRLDIRGALPPECGIAVMNHQSVLDAMIALCVARGPLPLIPVRTRYRWGMPGISPFLRAARFPFIRQQRASAEADLAAIEAEAERAARGDAMIFIFPEGHRTRTGDIGPFMPRGLRSSLRRVHRPVYCVVGDGMWRVRTLADVFTKLAGTRVTVRIIGPFTAPQDEQEIPGFIASLRDRMVTTLQESRDRPTSSTQTDADWQQATG
jgi:1-acyl-sn-glycerol-3-phosphate acyltransferase